MTLRTYAYGLFICTVTAFNGFMLTTRAFTAECINHTLYSVCFLIQ